MAFAKGLRPSRPERTAHRLGAHVHPAIAAALRAGPIGQSDLSPYRGPTTNQRGTSTCHAHSRAQLLYTAYAAVGKRLPFFPSPDLIARTTYADDRAAATPMGQPLPRLYDVGAELQSSSDATQRWGLVRIGWPNLAPTDLANFTDSPDGTAFTGSDGQLPAMPELTPPELHEAAARVTMPEYQVVGVGPSVVSLVIASLDVKMPLQSGGPVGPMYEALTAGQVAMPEPDGDGHAQVTDCYRPMTDAEREACGSVGKYVFAINGSWGLEWSARGVALVSEEWIESQWNFFPAVVS